MPYIAAADRYDVASLKRCGRSGLMLPRISLGLWQNFGEIDVAATGRAVMLRAFDRGVTHFDLANNYGPPPGSAETFFGQVLASDLKPYRDEMVISTKAGYRMWPGPYGEWGSRKYVLASLDQSLKRMGVDYVDIFYSHRFDPDTPLEETMGALAHAVKSGKALYAGVSNYSPAKTREAAAILKDLGVPLLIHQPPYSMLRRNYELDGLFPVLDELGVGAIVFSPLAQGLLTAKYLADVPADSRAARNTFLSPSRLTPDLRDRLVRLNALAERRGQSLAQMAILWTLRLPAVTSSLIGARNVAQLDDSLDALRSPDLSAEEIADIEAILAGLPAW
jgi:L-glyceraldehyde 3-phosphate reductase